jgi:hypothetical protein
VVAQFEQRGLHRLRRCRQLLKPPVDGIAPHKTPTVDFDRSAMANDAGAAN